MSHLSQIRYRHLEILCAEIHKKETLKKSSLDITMSLILCFLPYLEEKAEWVGFGSFVFFCVEVFTTQSTQWGYVERSQFTKQHFYWVA